MVASVPIHIMKNLHFGILTSNNMATKPKAKTKSATELQQEIGTIRQHTREREELNNENIQYAMDLHEWMQIGDKIIDLCKKEEIQDLEIYNHMAKMQLGIKKRHETMTKKICNHNLVRQTTEGYLDELRKELVKAQNRACGIIDESIDDTKVYLHTYFIYI